MAAVCWYNISQIWKINQLIKWRNGFFLIAQWHHLPFQNTKTLYGSCARDVKEATAKEKKTSANLSAQTRRHQERKYVFVSIVGSCYRAEKAWSFCTCSTASSAHDAWRWQQTWPCSTFSACHPLDHLHPVLDVHVSVLFHILVLCPCPSTVPTLREDWATTRNPPGRCQQQFSVPAHGLQETFTSQSVRSFLVCHSSCTVRMVSSATPVPKRLCNHMLKSTQWSQCLLSAPQMLRILF